MKMLDNISSTVRDDFPQSLQKEREFLMKGSCNNSQK